MSENSTYETMRQRIVELLDDKIVVQAENTKNLEVLYQLKDELQELRVREEDDWIATKNYAEQNQKFKTLLREARDEYPFYPQDDADARCYKDFLQRLDEALKGGSDPRRPCTDPSTDYDAKTVCAACARKDELLDKIVHQIYHVACNLLSVQAENCASARLVENGRQELRDLLINIQKELEQSNG